MSNGDQPGQDAYDRTALDTLIDEDEGATTIENITVVERLSPFRIPKGKYRGIVLPRMLSTKPSYQEKVDTLKAQIIADPDFRHHASVLAGAYAALRREEAALEEALSDVHLRLEATAQLMTEQFEAEDTGSLTLSETGDNIRVQPEPHTVVTEKDRFRVWCLEAGLERLMGLPWPTANKLVKERLLEGLGEPEGVTAFMRNKIVFKKGK